MEADADSLSDSETSRLEAEIFGKPVPLELRERVLQVLLADVEDGGFPSPDEEMKRIEKAKALLRRHGYRPKFEGASLKYSPWRRFLKALHLA